MVLQPSLLRSKQQAVSFRGSIYFFGKPSRVHGGSTTRTAGGTSSWWIVEHTQLICWWCVDVKTVHIQYIDVHRCSKCYILSWIVDGLFDMYLHMFFFWQYKPMNYEHVLFFLWLCVWYLKNTSWFRRNSTNGPHFFKAGDALPQDGVAGLVWWFFSAKRSQVNS